MTTTAKATRRTSPTYSRADVEALRAKLVAQANAAHAQYPQYAGHWDAWRLAEVTRRQTGKSGLQFETGDLTLVSPETRTDKIPPRGTSLPYAQWPEVLFTTAYSFRTGNDTAVRADRIREITIVD